MEEFVVQLEESGKDPRLAFGRVPDDGLLELTADGFGLYSFCTESIEDYLPHLDVSGKRCLTVAASGDQVIALLMAGAAEVVTFDLVWGAGEATELKMNAMAHFDWDSLGQFAGEVWNKALSPRGFSQLCDRAPKARYHGYGSMMQRAVNGLPIGRAVNVFKRHQIYGYTGYLASGEAFDTAKSAVTTALSDGRVSFVRSDVRDLPHLGLGEFDVIVLSNILGATFATRRNRHVFGGMTVDDERLDRAGELAYARSLVASMIWPVAGMLSDSGIMMASYHYGCEPINNLSDDCRYCGDPVAVCQCDRTDPFAETASRRQLFSPPPGFSVEERGWQTVNSELSGEDVAVFVRKVVE
jgi:hypothetical protein